jgi:hypothetical protein
VPPHVLVRVWVPVGKLPSIKKGQGRMIPAQRSRFDSDFEAALGKCVFHNTLNCLVVFNDQDRWRLTQLHSPGLVAAEIIATRRNSFREIEVNLGHF